MIKRIIGILASVAVLALVVFTILGSGSYTSILPPLKSKEVTQQTQKEPKKRAENSTESKTKNVVTDKAELADSLKSDAK